MLTGRYRAAGRAAAFTLGCALLLAPALTAAGDTVRNAEAWVLQAINVQAAWTISRGSGVTVAVIDSGVNPSVSDLVGSVTTGPDLTGVGTPPSNPNWGMHGTWMASLIAGHGHGAGSGIIGVAPEAHILSIRVITDRSDPGYQQYEHQTRARGQRELATAIRYAVRHGAQVISMSLGYNAPSAPVRQALQFALGHGVVVVASSGNSGGTSSDGKRGAPYSFPADYPGVLGVAAVSRSGAPAGFSSDNLSVSVAAPGVQVPAQGRDGQYWLVSGTSPACALTAGVAALIKSAYPSITPAEVREAIISTTTNRPPGGYDEQLGFGTVDAAAALAEAARLVHQAPVGRGFSAIAHFGGGPSAVPPPPVGPRSPVQLVAFSMLGFACLLVCVAAAGRLVQIRRRSRLAALGPEVAPGPPGFGPPSAAPEADVRPGMPASPGAPPAVPGQTGPDLPASRLPAGPGLPASRLPAGPGERRAARQSPE
jgi:type VII secretion-associated serine protease mycosin